MVALGIESRSDGRWWRPRRLSADALAVLPTTTSGLTSRVRLASLRNDDCAKQIIPPFRCAHAVAGPDDNPARQVFEVHPQFWLGTGARG